MVRKKKHTLEFDEEFEYCVVGISTHHSDYRLVWSINSKLDLRFEKQDIDYLVSHKKGMESSSHPLFTFCDEDNHLDYFLIKNKSAGKQLIPEKPMIDYFIFVNDSVAFEFDLFVQKLKSVDSVLGVFPIDADEIETQHLIFD